MTSLAPHPDRSQRTASFDRPTTRAQAEPLAALVAVATVCLALGLYAGALAGVVPGTADRAAAEPTLENAWAAIGTDGVYEPASTDDPLESVPSDRLPGDATVVATVTTPSSGEQAIVTQATYVRGTHDPDASLEPLPEDEALKNADVATRPIAIGEPTGAVSSGTLYVEVRS